MKYYIGFSGARACMLIAAILLTLFARGAQNSKVIAVSANSVAQTLSAQGSIVQLSPIYGFSGSSIGMVTANLQAINNSGFSVMRVALYWNLYEPQENVYNQTYIQTLRGYLTAIYNSGLKVTLWIGFHQNVPDWVYAKPNSHLVDQYGDVYNGTTDSGADFANWIWNPSIRSIMASTLLHVFSDFGSNFWAVSPCIGRYGEIQYPPPDYNNHSNCYWSFDTLAQMNCPVAGWQPGDPSPNGEAKTFINWYVDSYANCINWIIGQVRQYYNGTITFGMPGWGFSQWFDEVVSCNLNGSSIPDQWGQVSRGLNWDRILSEINDSNFMPWQTGVECMWSIYGGIPANDSSENPQMWSMAKLQSYEAHKYGFKIMCEPSGDETSEITMENSFEHSRQYGYIGILWFNEYYFFEQNNFNILQKYMNSTNLNN